MQSKMQYFDKRGKPQSFLRRLLLHPSRIAAFVCLLFIIAFVRYQKPSFEDPRSAAHRQLFESSSPEKKDGGRIAIVTFTTDQKSYTHLSLKNHVHYAKKHGYDFIVDFEQNAPKGPMWHKFEMIEAAIHTGKYDWVWWMDFDTLITNQTVRLEDVIAEHLVNATNPDDVDFFVTPDCFELNAGSFITRGHERSIKFFDAVRAYHEANATYQHQMSEQDCMRDLLLKSDQWFHRRIFMPQHAINAFPEEIKCWDAYQKPWQHGFYVIHFAGAWAHIHEDDPTGLLMRKYEMDTIW